MTRLTIIFIFLFVVQEAYPQFNSIEFQKDLPSVKVVQSSLVRPEKEGLDQRLLFEKIEPVVEKSTVLLASLPLENFSMTSEFGYRSDPFSGKRQFHRGIDLKANRSQVLSMLHGKVAATGHDPLLGNFVKIRHGNYHAIYGHLSQIWALKGDHVLPGSELGISGSTGRASGDHLHLTIKKGEEYINPTLFIQMLSKLSTKDELIQFLSNQKHHEKPKCTPNEGFGDFRNRQKRKIYHSGKRDPCSEKWKNDRYRRTEGFEREGCSD